MLWMIAMASAMTCATMKDLVALHTSEAALLGAIHFETFHLSEVRCFEEIGLPQDVLTIVLQHMEAEPIPTIVTPGRASGPAGVAVTWRAFGCHLAVRIENKTSAPVEIDWMRSVYAPNGGAAVALVPGTSSKMSSMISIPPTVAPPGTYVEESLFRKDDLPGTDSAGCMFSIPSEATVTLSLLGQWFTQSLSFKADEAIANQQKADLARVDRLMQEPAKLSTPVGTLTCADVKGLVAARLTETQLLEAVQGQTIGAKDLECIQNAGIPASVVAELAAHVVGGP